MAQAPAKPIAEIEFYRWTGAASGVSPHTHTQAVTRGAPHVRQGKDGERPFDENNWGNLMATFRVTNRNVKYVLVLFSAAGLLYVCRYSKYAGWWKQQQRKCPSKPAALKVIRKIRRSQAPCNKPAYLVAADVYIQALLMDK